MYWESKRIISLSFTGKFSQNNDLKQLGSDIKKLRTEFINCRLVGTCKYPNMSLNIFYVRLSLFESPFAHRRLKLHIGRVTSKKFFISWGSGNVSKIEDFATAKNKVFRMLCIFFNLQKKFNFFGVRKSQISSTSNKFLLTKILGFQNSE